MTATSESLRRRLFQPGLTVAALIWSLIVLDGQQAVFRSKVDMVLLDVLPTVRGIVIPDLRPEEIDLRDNGIPQTVTYISKDSVGLGVQLLLDTSSSLTPRDLEHLRQGAQSLAALLRNGDELDLLTFSHVVAVHGTRNMTTLGATFDGLQPYGHTALHDALIAGFRLADRQGGLRPVVIAFSDGSDTASFLTAKDVDDAARMSWASFFAVTPRARRETVLKETAELTGGEVLVLSSDLSGLPKVFEQILERLRQRYLIGFTPTSNAAGWHELDVRVKRSNVKVVARRGYLRR